MSVENLAPGTLITASNLLQEAYQYYEESGGIIPTPQRKEYYVALYDTQNNLMGRFIGKYIGIMENTLMRNKYQRLLLKSKQIIDYIEYTDDEDNNITTLLFTNIRKSGKIGTGIRKFKPIDYEEGEFNNDIEERVYNESSILEGEIGLEFPFEFAQKHMKFYDYKIGKQIINKSMADVISSIIIKKTGQNVRGIVDPNILNGGKTKRYFRKKRKCLTRKYKRKGLKRCKKCKKM
jgi:hypothetical protein